MDDLPFDPSDVDLEPDYESMTREELIQCCEAHDAHHQEHHERESALKEKLDRHRNGKFPAVYAAIYPTLCDVAKDCGYALSIHGSLLHDFDLVAVPWTSYATPAEDLIEEIISRFSGSFVHTVGAIGEKPHGRRVWTIYLDGHAYIDLGVMPTEDHAKLFAAQAYQVIGGLCDRETSLCPTEILRALNYFAAGEYDEDFLPWPKG